MPDNTLGDFDDHGELARTIDADLAASHAVLEGFAALGISLADVTAQLEDEGVASFSKSFDDLLATLGTKASSLG
jgi:transaldolase